LVKLGAPATLTADVVARDGQLAGGTQGALHAPDLEVTKGVLHAQGGVDATLAFEGAPAPGEAPQREGASVRVAVERGALDVRGDNLLFGADRLELADVTGDVTFTLRSDEVMTSGELSLTSPRAVAHVDGRAIEGTVDAKVHVAQWPLGGEAPIELGATSLALKRAHPERPPAPDQASLVVKRGTLRLADPPTLEGPFSLEMSTAQHLLRLLAGGAEVPPWVEIVAGASPLSASGNAWISGNGALVLRDVHATAGPLSVEAIYATDGSNPNGLALVEAGPMAVGIEVDGPRTSVHALGAHGWFTRRLAAIDHAGQHSPEL
jgi:hypothetical protein